MWFLPLQDSWVRAKDHPAACVETHLSEERDERCPPGTIWQREVDLLLPAGTPLLSRVSTPLVERFEPMEYLTRDRRGLRRHVEETWFVVRGNYRIIRSKEPNPIARARSGRDVSDAPQAKTRDKPRS